MNYHYATIGLGGIALDVEIRWEVTKFFPATWDDPAEGGEVEIDCVKVVGIEGCTYELARPEFKSWAKDLDEAAWIYVEENLMEDLYEAAVNQ
jgi:hypothetical protein